MQFEDSDFGNALCNLHSIDELLADKSVSKVVWDIASNDTEIPASEMSHALFRHLTQQAHLVTQTLWVLQTFTTQNTKRFDKARINSNFQIIP